MSRPRLVTYKTTALTQGDLEEELQDVLSDVDEVEITGPQARRARKHGGVKKSLKGKRASIRLHNGVDDFSNDEIASYSEDYNRITMPVERLLRSTPEVLRLFSNVEADLTEVTDVDDLRQKLNDLSHLQGNETISVSVRAPHKSLENFKGYGFSVTVDLAEVTQKSVDEVVARSENCVNNFVSTGNNPLPPAIDKSVEELEKVEGIEMKPIVDVDEIYSELESLQEKYDDSAIPKIQEKIDAIQYSPNITLFFVTKLNFIKDYVSYKMKGSPYELAYLEHKITMMSRANDFANLDLKIRNETDGEKRKQLSKEKSEYELNSHDIFSKLESAVMKSAKGISDEDRIVAESSAEELLRTYMLLTILYYKCFDEFNVLKIQKDRNLSAVRNMRGLVEGNFKRDTKNPEFKEGLRVAKEHIEKIALTPVKGRLFSFKSLKI